MKKINEDYTIEYKGYTVNFIILPKTKEYLDKRGVDLFKKDKKIPESSFFEVTLFELIDENEDGLPDEKFGKNFKVVYYGVIERQIKKEPEGFVDKFFYDENKVLDDGQINPLQGKLKQPFGIRYKILKN